MALKPRQSLMPDASTGVSEEPFGQSAGCAGFLATAGVGACDLPLLQITSVLCVCVLFLHIKT